MYVLEKYKPSLLSEFISPQAVREIKKWYEEGFKKPLLITGPIGSGKSSLVYLFAKEYDLTLYELTPADKRDKARIESEAKVVSKSRSVFSKKNLLFFDNVDVFFGDERGGLEAIAKIAKESTNPIIFVASDSYNKKMLRIKNISQNLKIRKPQFRTISSILKNIVQKEGFDYEQTALDAIAQRAEGDLRSAILDMDAVRYYGIKLENVDFLGSRERKVDVFKTVTSLFKVKSLKEAIEIRDKADLDYSMLHNWIVENLHLFYKDENLKEAYELVSIGDINMSRIYVRQNWTFLKYFLVLGIIAPAIYPKKDSFSYRVNFPQFIRHMGKETSLYSKNKKASKILKTIIHASTNRITQDIEYYKQIFSDKYVFERLLEELDDDERDFIVDYFSLPKEFKKMIAKTQITITKEKVTKMQKKDAPKVEDKPKEQKTLSSFFK